MAPTGRHVAAADADAPGSVRLFANRVSKATEEDLPGAMFDEAETFNVEVFKRDFKLKVIRKTDERVEFDMVGVGAPIANALRRILIAEVPTIAIEKVFIFNNTSMIHDEVLAHRLGLIPIKADPRYFEYKMEGGESTDLNTVVFHLKIKCTRNPHASPDATKDEDKYINSKITTAHLAWVPQGHQAEIFGDNPIRPVHDDIVIARLRPGQELDIQLHCEKGIGRVHAKWSPVATASYRLLPKIRLLREITDDDADELAKCFSPGVIEVITKNGRKVARVKNARNDTMSREVFRHPKFENAVELSRVGDHFIFSVESVGILPPEVLVREAVTILMQKCAVVKGALEAVMKPSNEV